MKYEEYIQTEAFRRFFKAEDRRKRWRLPILIGSGIILLMMIGALICLDFIPEEKRTDTLTVLGYVLIGASLAGLIVLAIFQSMSTSRDNNGNRLPAYSAAMLLFALENLSSGWHVENGLLTFCISVTTGAEQGKFNTVSLIRKEEKLELDLSGFSGTLTMQDILELILYGLFNFLENNAVQITAIKCFFCVDEVRGKEEFLYRDGKWRWLVRTIKGRYCNVVKYARRKNLIA